MFIYNFHRLVRHRYVWGAFAIVTALAFVSAGSCYRATTEADTVARINGRPVSREEFGLLERAVRGLGRNRDNEMNAAEAATQVWERVAALQVGNTLGLQPSVHEMREAIRETFSPQGAFDINRYRATLAENRLSTDEYEATIRRQMELHKVDSLIASAAWIPTMELNDELTAWTDQVTLRYALASNRFERAPMNLSEAKLRAYFDAHRESFRLPNRVQVQYVALSISNFLARVSVPEEDVRAYYDDHSERFVRTTDSNTTETVKLDEARPKIIETLRRELACTAAVTNLQQTFVETAMKGGDRGFATAARVFNLPVERTPLFGADDPIPDVENPRAFREAAFDLDPAQPEGRFNVVRGDAFAYAMTVGTNSPAHMPTFEEAVDRVRPLAQQEARTQAFKDYAADLHGRLQQAIKEGKSFEAACRAQALTVSTSVTFAAHAVTRDQFPETMTIVQAALHLQAGALSETQFTPDDEAVFVHVDARQAGDPLSAEMLRGQVRGSLERSRAAALVSAWREWNLRQLGLKVAERMAHDLATVAAPREE